MKNRKNKIEEVALSRFRYLFSLSFLITITFIYKIYCATSGNFSSTICFTILLTFFAIAYTVCLVLPIIQGPVWMYFYPKTRTLRNAISYIIYLAIMIPSSTLGFTTGFPEGDFSEKIVFSFFPMCLGFSIAGIALAIAGNKNLFNFQASAEADCHIHG